MRTKRNEGAKQKHATERHRSVTASNAYPLMHPKGLYVLHGGKYG